MAEKQMVVESVFREICWKILKKKQNLFKIYKKYQFEDKFCLFVFFDCQEHDSVLKVVKYMFFLAFLSFLV